MEMENNQNQISNEYERMAKAKRKRERELDEALLMGLLVGDATGESTINMEAATEFSGGYD